MVLQPVQDVYFNQKAGNKQFISEILGTALNLDCVLEEWQAALPEHLRLKFPCTQTEAVFRRQATLLRMRYVLKNSGSKNLTNILKDIWKQRLLFLVQQS